MLSGKVAIVTGASRGIGRETALTLAGYGATVIVNYCGSKDKAEAVVEEIKAAGGNAKAYQGDVSDFDVAKEMITSVKKEFGSIDILVNNAGITKDNLIMRMSEEEFDKVHHIFESFGKAEKITENLMDAVVGVSGSGPAYVYMFIEAMADAGVAQGLPRKQAYTFAAQTLLGSAKMVLETGQHPGELKDAVCSPAGTTIEAVNTLEKKGLRSAVIEAVNAAAKKNHELGKPKKKEK